MPLPLFLTRITKSRFARNVAIVASGTAGAQAITMAFAPIITRLYGPEAFGVLGTFMAIVAVMTPLAALSYPIAIVLPKDDTDAIGIARLSLLIALVTAGLTTLILLGFRDPILQTLNLKAISAFIFLIPVVMFFAACLAVMNQWVIRKKLFKLKAKVAVAQAFLVQGAKAGIGFFNPAASVLILVATAGSAMHAFMLTVGVRRSAEPKGTSASAGEPAPLLKLARRHSDFPLYRAPQIFINAASQGLPVIMLASFFGPAAAGFYALGRSVMGLPATLIAQSVGEVFYPRITEASHQGENQHRLILRATVGLAAVGIVPFGIVFAIGPWLFGFVFGSEWTVAGEYARWLSLMLFFNFINRPSVAAVPVLGLQRGLVIYEIFSTGSKILALYLGFVVFGSDQVAVALFGILGAAAYIALIAWVMLAARNADAGTEYAAKAG
jgi:O-antigen/teichoic acid export membrane protein